MDPSSRPGRRTTTVALGLLGVSVLVLSAVVSDAELERRLLGEATGQLAWGPRLFLVLLAFHGAALVLLAWARLRRGARAEADPPAPTPRPVSEPRWSLWLGLLLVAALALRLWRLGTGLWLDEVFTLVDFVRLPLAQVVTSFPSQNQHMLYSILAHGSVSLLGESAAALRLPAALFGVASIWALFQLGRQVVGPREAFLASALMTFSYHHVWFSQNARGYSGLLFFALASTWLWLRASALGSSPCAARGWALYALSIVLGVWIHITMVFVVMAHGVVWVADWVACWRGSVRRESMNDSRRPTTGPLVAWIFAGTLSLQLYALALPEFFRSALHEESLASEWTSLGWLVRESVSRLSEAGLGALLLAAGAVVLAFGWLEIFRRDWRPALLLVLPAVLGGGTVLASGHNLWPRFFFFCMGFVLLLAVRGGIALPRWVSRRITAPLWRRRVAASGLAAIVAVIGLSAATVPRCYTPPKQDFAGARDLVESELEPGDGTVVVGLAAAAFSRYYAPDWPVAGSEEELAAVASRHRRTWLVYTLPIHMRVWHPEIWDKVQKDFELIQVFPGTLGDGALYVCRTREAPAAPSPTSGT